MREQIALLDLLDLFALLRRLRLVANLLRLAMPAGDRSVDAQSGDAAHLSLAKFFSISVSRLICSHFSPCKIASVGNPFSHFTITVSHLCIEGDEEVVKGAQLRFRRLDAFERAPVLA